jgi:GNAT superfamily N-acetyltransferase
VIKIVRLSPGDEQRLRTIRLRALADAPVAFSTTLEEASAKPLEDWVCQLKQLVTFIAMIGSEGVGIARGVPHDSASDAACLISMWVAPEFRRQGVAAALLESVVAWAKIKGFRRLVLDVTEGNAPAMSLYRKKGFVPNGIISALSPPRQHIREYQLERML